MVFNSVATKALCSRIPAPRRRGNCPLAFSPVGKRCQRKTADSYSKHSKYARLHHPNMCGIAGFVAYPATSVHVEISRPNCDSRISKSAMMCSVEGKVGSKCPKMCSQQSASSALTTLPPLPPQKTGWNCSSLGLQRLGFCDSVRALSASHICPELLVGQLLKPQGRLAWPAMLVPFPQAKLQSISVKFRFPSSSLQMKA